MLDLVIVGAGGFGREVYRWAQAAFDPTEHRIKGFLSNRPADLAGFGIEAPLLGDDEAYRIEESDRFLFAVGRPEVKRRMIERLKARGARFATLVHPTAVVAPTAKLGEGVVVCPFALVSDHVVLEDFAMLNFYSSVGHDGRIGRFAILSPYSTVNGFAVLGEEVFLASHVTVTARRKVGDGARVSANVAVHVDVPPRTLVYGSPAKLATIFTPGD
jgi:sugar O-acyltransferase (sialic acid O-acetyltransferase NeuD family)